MAHKKTKTLKDYGSSVKKKNPVVGALKLGGAPYRVKIKNVIEVFICKRTGYGTPFQRKK